MMHPKDNSASDVVTSRGSEGEYGPVFPLECVSDEQLDENQVTSLRYIDYICGHVKMKPVIEEVEKCLGIHIELIEAPGDMSGPR
jgi:hypothetical protein